MRPFSVNKRTESLSVVQNKLLTVNSQRTASLEICCSLVQIIHSLCMIFWESWEASIKIDNCAYNSCDIQQHLFLFSPQHKKIIENLQLYMAQYQSWLFPALYSRSKVCIISSSPQHTSLISHRHLNLKSASQIVYMLRVVYLPWARGFTPYANNQCLTGVNGGGKKLLHSSSVLSWVCQKRRERARKPC